MNLLMIPWIALKALSLNKLRTGLTMLGIIIGVGAVICVVAIGEGASARVEQAITNIGANMIWVEAGGVNRNGVRTGVFGTTRMSMGDFEAIKERVPLVTCPISRSSTRTGVLDAGAESLSSTSPTSLRATRPCPRCNTRMITSWPT